MATVKTKFRKSSVRDSEYYKPGGYISYARYVIERLMAAGKPVAVKYASSLRSFIRFNGDVEVSFSRFDANLMSAYETWLRESGKSRNTTSYYLRNLQAIYNRAADDGLVGHGANPFRRVYTGVDLTVKRALPISVIRRIRDADLTLYPQIAYARDMFMFSFCTRGMSFVTMIIRMIGVYLPVYQHTQQSVYVLILYPRDVVCRHGLSQTMQSARRHAFISQKEDRTAGRCEMEPGDGRDSQPLCQPLDKLSFAYSYCRGHPFGTQAVYHSHAVHQPTSAAAGPNAWHIHQSYNVCRPTFMGHCRKGIRYTGIHNKPLHGA